MLGTKASTLLRRRSGYSEPMKARVFGAIRNLSTSPQFASCTPAERAILRSARRDRASRTLLPAESSSGTSSSTATSSSSSTRSVMASMKTKDPRILFGLGVGVPVAILTWGIVDPNSPPALLASKIGLTGAVEGLADEFARPSRPKLLPDWGMMPNVPQDMTPPHTLVLDLENTLVNSTWDRKHGWRHAKRPGVDRFLAEMAQYYEIVLYAPSHEGVAEPVVNALDKSGCIMHRLFRDACYYKNGKYVKDLDALNRNVSRIVHIDDDEGAAQFHPENLIRVRPYDDPADRSDRTLERITPLLVEIAKEGYNDVPAVLRQFKGMDADEIATELENRVVGLRDRRERGARRGLGRFGNVGREGLPDPEMAPAPDTQTTSGVPGGSQAQLTSKDLVGPMEPPSNGGGVGGWLKRRQKSQEEDQMRKMEKWNEVMAKKSAEKKL